MAKHTFTKFTDIALLKRYRLIKNTISVFYILYFLIIVILLYLFSSKNFGDISVALFVPLLVLPAAMAPIYIYYNLLKLEKNSRNI